MSEAREMPLGKVFSQLAKDYVGTFTKRLENLPIRRYYYALILIHETTGKMSQQALANELFMDKVSVVRMVDYLSEHHCVQRRQNPADRREQLLELTTEGKNLVPEIKKAMAETNKFCLQNFTDEEIGQFEKFLSRVSCNLNQQPQDSYQIEFIKNEK